MTAAGRPARPPQRRRGLAVPSGALYSPADWAGFFFFLQ